MTAKGGAHSHTCLKDAEALPVTGVDQAGAVVLAYAEGPAGKAALHYAATEARLRRAQLQVVHELVGAERPDRMCTVREYLQHRDRVAARVRRVVADVAPDLSDVYVVITTDRIADEIVVASRRAALVVLGSTATHEVTAALLEGVAREVAHAAHCPVVLVPDSDGSADPRLLVCGVDRSPESLAALQWAATDAGLRGVNVLAVEFGHRGSMIVPDSRRPQLTEWVDENAPAEPTTIVCRTDYGPAAKSLLTEASARTGVLVLGRHDQHGRFSRSVLDAATAQTRVPVVVVPMPERAEERHSRRG